MNLAWQADADLTTFNTFGLAARAKRYLAISDTSQLAAALADAVTQRGPLLIMGGGSNMLFTQDWAGTVLHLQTKGIQVVEEAADYALVQVAAGEVWHELVLWAVAHGLGGIENLALIPGSVGASPVQNIGAYGVELKDVFHSCEVMNLATQQTHWLDKAACQFGYRDSVFKNSLKGQVVITQVVFKLTKHPQLNTTYGAIGQVLAERGIAQPSIHDVMEAVIHIRRSKLPDPAVIGNAGSFFKNPTLPIAQFEALQQAYPQIPSFPAGQGQVKVPAAWLIEQRGWKGKRLGNYGVHAQQALVLVNYGGAAGAAIWQLAQDIQADVAATFGIVLHPEVNVF